MKLAVLLPVYRKDAPDYLENSLTSILNQTFSDFRLMIGVDGPVGADLDEKLARVGEEPRVEVVRFAENRGLACVLNDLLERAMREGFDYYARMDADDISLPHRFELQMAFLEAHPEIDVVGGAISEIDEKGCSRNKTVVYPAGPDECRRFFARRNPHAHPAVVFRRSFFEKTGHAYRPEYRQNQDTMLWFDGLMHGTRHANIPDVVLLFRMTDSLFKKRRNGWQFAKKQLADRKMINRGLRYGFRADLFAYAMFVLLVLPPSLKKLAYRIFR